MAIGLCCVARAAERLGWASNGLAARVEACVAAQGLPTDTSLAHEDIMQFATHDKKRHGNTVNLVVPLAIGSCEVRKTTIEEFAHVVELGCGASA